MDGQEKTDKQVTNSDKTKDTNGTKKAGAKNNQKSASRSAQLKKKLAQTEQERDELKDRLMRKAAEFDNYRKRTEGEFSQLISNANADLITEMLTVIDDFERLLKTGKQSGNGEALYQGVELIYKNLLRLLEKQGVQAIEAVGKEFDPEKHDALMQVENTEHAPNTVVDEHVKGYEMNGRVLRHSQVLVSK